jgi:hypothetical protein
MEIIIENYFENSIEANKIAFWLFAKNILIVTASLLILGIYYLADGLRKSYDISSTSTRYTESTNTVIKNISYTNYHLNTDIGAILIILSLLSFFDLYRTRKRFKKKAFKYYDSRKRANQKCLMRLNEQSIFYQDYELTWEQQWTRITEYKIMKGYLFLFRDGSYVDSIRIKISEIEKSKFEDLMLFINQRILEKRVKGVI